MNNAGVMWCPRTLTKEGFETQLGVNFLGIFSLQVINTILFDHFFKLFYYIQQTRRTFLFNILAARFTKTFSTKSYCKCDV